jgi:nudix-type nucleoside diphosphatase (YffH/AdpP family)
MRRPHRVEIRRQRRLFDDFFKVDEVVVSHQRIDGKMSDEQRRLVFERGDAVAALLYNPENNSVVLVDQFKLPVLIGRRRDNPATMAGWITEAVAGMINQDETPEEAIIRETYEETGYRIDSPQLISMFFSSPGGTSERIFLYYAEITEKARAGQGGGVGDEDVRVVHKPAQELFARLADGEIEDPKLAIAAAWLQERQRKAEPLKHSVARFRMVGPRDLIVGYHTGSVENVKRVSVWVNSENTNMMMDRFLGKSISATIRFLGANKDGGNVIDDTIQDSLRNVLGERARVPVGSVLVTESGMLRSANQVRRIFHVATTEGSPGQGFSGGADVRKLKECVEEVLKRADRENTKLWRMFKNKLFGRAFGENSLDSIIFPLLGSGDAGLSVETVAEAIIPAALDYLRDHPNSTLKQVYFLAFRAREKSACEQVFRRYCESNALQRMET